MAKVDDTNLADWDKPPLPSKLSTAAAGKGFLRQLSLGHIMVSLIYFAVLFLAIRTAMMSTGFVPVMMVCLIVGAGVCVFGLMIVNTQPRLASAGWICFVVGYTIMAGGTTAFFAIPSVVILIGSLMYLGRRRRANEQDGLLWVMRVAADRGIPLASGVQAFSTQVDGIYRIWCESLADILHQGTRLSDALEQLPRLIPRWSALLVRMGEESGHLASGLEEAVNARNRRLPIVEEVSGRLAYLSWVVTIGGSVIGFVLYFVIPKYEAIFMDFGMNLPGPTIFVIKASRVLVGYSWIPAGVFFILGLRLMFALFWQNDLSLPFVDRLFVRRHSSQIFRSLAVVVSSGRPISPALLTLSECYPTAWVRRRLKGAGSDTNLGLDWASALQENGLINRSEVGVLVSAQRAGNLAWALRELAETSDRRSAYRLMAWTQMLFIAAMLIIGLLALLLGLAYFLPLVELISRLAT